MTDSAAPDPTLASHACQVLDDPAALRRFLQGLGLTLNGDIADMPMLPQACSEAFDWPNTQDPELGAWLSAQVVASGSNDVFEFSLTAYGLNDGAGDPGEAIVAGDSGDISELSLTLAPVCREERVELLLGLLQSLLARAAIALPPDWRLACEQGRELAFQTGNAPELRCSMCFSDDGADTVFLSCERDLLPGEWQAWLANPDILGRRLEAETAQRTAAVEICRAWLRAHSHPLAELPLTLFMMDPEDEQASLVLRGEDDQTLFVSMSGGAITSLSIIAADGGCTVLGPIGH